MIKAAEEDLFICNNRSNFYSCSFALERSNRLSFLRNPTYLCCLMGATVLSAKLEFENSLLKTGSILLCLFNFSNLLCTAPFTGASFFFWNVGVTEDEKWMNQELVEEYHSLHTA